jgi:nucleoside-diphosphate-sugar epimerase
MNIILTGATGTLGSQILFSLFEAELDVIDTVFLPIRSKKSAFPEHRVKKMLNSEYAPLFVQKNKAEILKKIQVVDAALLLEPSSFLQKESIDYFIHAAGFVNLSTDESAKKEIFQENFEFTRLIFKAYTPYIKKFVYISTAFANGDLGGVQDNDYTKASGEYRNPYEASKHESEKFLLNEAKKKGIAIQILRPSVLGGNITDMPHFFISKYMVFYLFAKFFNNCNPADSIRITTTKTAGLNIIPTDYASRVIVKAIRTNIEQLNIVHSQETNLMMGMAKIFEIVGFTNFTFTTDQINPATGFASQLEQFYYETIGIHLAPYLTSKPNTWNTSLQESILPIPSYDLEEYLSQTVSFAKAKNFRNQVW